MHCIINCHVGTVYKDAKHCLKKKKKKNKNKEKTKKKKKKKKERTASKSLVWK